MVCQALLDGPAEDLHDPVGLLGEGLEAANEVSVILLGGGGHPVGQALEIDVHALYVVDGKEEPARFGGQLSGFSLLSQCREKLNEEGVKKPRYFDCMDLVLFVCVKKL